MNGERPLDVAVIGGGVMGLTAARDLLGRGYRVTVYERDAVLGGMSASFDFAGRSLERFYHFICGPDRPLFQLLEELGLSDRLRWRHTSMGYFHDGILHPWGTPAALLQFRPLSPWERIRSGMHAWRAIRRNHWHDLDGRTARGWLEQSVGPRAYALLWERLLGLKFHEHADHISAAWIWSRIRRVGRSRHRGRERLGYLQGGTRVLIEALSEEIREGGGALRPGTQVLEVLSGEAGVRGVRTRQGVQPHDAVISTVPLPLVADLLPSTPSSVREPYAILPNLAVVCAVFLLKAPLSPHFWVNISDDAVEAPGLVEFGRLNPSVGNVVYIPYYLPRSHPWYDREDDFFLEMGRRTLARLNPEVAVEASTVTRCSHAQPVCRAGFRSVLPPIRTATPRLLSADTSHYYPEDRSVSESIRLGRHLAHALLEEIA